MLDFVLLALAIAYIVIGAVVCVRLYAAELDRSPDFHTTLRWILYLCCGVPAVWPALLVVHRIKKRSA
jgi:hypothetical protein